MFASLSRFKFSAGFAVVTVIRICVTVLRAALVCVLRASLVGVLLASLRLVQVSVLRRRRASQVQVGVLRASLV